MDEEDTTFEDYEDDSCCFQQVSPEFFRNEEFASNVAEEINKRAPLFIELGAKKAEEFSEPLWYLRDYVKEAFEKYPAF